MKKLAKLTALLLTGVMLLLLASCGAAPNPGPGGSSGLTAAEAKARREIFNAINEVRKERGSPLLREVPKLTQLEQEFIEHFREAGTNGLSQSEVDKLEGELANKQKEAGWLWNGSLSYSSWTEPVKLTRAYEGDTPEFRAMLREKGVAANDGSVALSVGVATIEGKIYWTITMLKPKT